jgi:hypothetical protein
VLHSRGISRSLSVLSRFIIFLVLAASILQAVDKVRVENRSYQASAQYGVSGKGVIYALIDCGFDWRNNEWYHPH